MGCVFFIVFEYFGGGDYFICYVVEVVVVEDIWEDGLLEFGYFFCFVEVFVNDDIVLWFREGFVS